MKPKFLFNVLLHAIHQLVENSSRFVVAKYSPICASYPYATIQQFDDSGIREVAFGDTEKFPITRYFLNN